MATLAEPRRSHFQQLRIVGSVGFMAIRTIFHYGGMLPQEWASPFGVAGETVLRGGRLDELLRVGAAMRVVTTGAGHLALAIGHMR